MEETNQNTAANRKPNKAEQIIVNFDRKEFVQSNFLEVERFGLAGFLVRSDTLQKALLLLFGFYPQLPSNDREIELTATWAGRWQNQRVRYVTVVADRATYEDVFDTCKDISDEIYYAFAPHQRRENGWIVKER